MDGLPVRLVKPLGYVRKHTIRQLVSYCTIVMASALTRSDTGICRLACILPLAVAVYDYGLISSDVSPFTIFKLHLSAVGEDVRLA